MTQFKKMCAALFSMALCWEVFAAAPHASLPGPTVPDRLGVNIHFTTPLPGELEMLAAGGFRWVRMDFVWAATEKVAGKYDFAAYEYLLAALEKYKIRAIFILDYGNPIYGADGSVRTDEGRKAFARWTAAAATHFKGRGILWEIWNEPNGGFWKPKANLDEYAALALEASKAIRTAAPDEAIVGPATSEVDFLFLEGCFKAGLLEYWDAVSVHPYRQSGPEGALSDYHKLRKLIAHYAPKDKTILILSGEWGYSASWQHVDVDKQGKMLSRQWLTNLANGIPLSIWYDWHDDGKDAKDPEHHFGTVANDYHAGRDPVYDPKPAYLAAKTLTTVLGGFTFEKRIGWASAPDDYVLLFKKGDERRLAVWRSTSDTYPISIDSNDEMYDVVSHTGEKLASIEAKDLNLHLVPGDVPLFLIPKGETRRLVAMPETHPYRVTYIPVPAKVFMVRIENVSEAAWKGKMRLKGYDGIQVANSDQAFEFVQGESEKTLTFALTAPPESSFRVGLFIDSPGLSYEKPVGSYHALPIELLCASKIVADGDAKVKAVFSTMMAPPPEALFGSNQSVLKLNYFFDAGWKFLQFELPDTVEKHLGSPRAVGMWIYGDGFRTALRLRLNDSTNQTWQPSGPEIDWRGWRYVEIPINASAGHWGGANDDVMHYPLRWQSPLVLDNPSKQSKEGSLYIAEPVVIY